METVSLTPRRRPEYMASLDDLVPYPDTCPDCGGPLVRLNLEIPERWRDGAHAGPAKWDALGGYVKYLCDGCPCPACEVRRAAARLFPPERHTQIVSPVEAELASLRAAAAPAPRVRPGVNPAGARFLLGTVLVTKDLLRELARRCVPGFDETVVGGEVRARPYLDGYLERHARGDLGVVGDLNAADPEAGQRLGPLAPLVDRAAAAVKSGRGSVRSAYQVGDSQTGFAFKIWTAVGGDPVTVAALDLPE